MTKRDQNLVAVAILALVAVGAYWYFVWQPATDELDQVEERVARLDSANAKARKEAQSGRLEELKRDVERANQQLAVMRQLVPTGNEVPALLDQVAVVAREAGLEMAGVKPEAIVPGEQFDTYRYSLQVQGSYHQTARFLADVGSLTRIMAPVGVQVTASNANAAVRSRRKLGPDEQLLGVSFELQTFVAKTAPAAKEATP